MMMPMMGAGLVLMLLVVLLVIGAPILIIVLAAGGGLAKLFKTRDRSSGADPQPPVSRPAFVRKCPTCGRGVKADWNICPSCGATLT